MDKMPKLRSAGILITYKCPLTCRHCRYTGGPDKGGPDNGQMSMETAHNIFSGLSAMNVDSVHLTGGDAFLYQYRLLEILDIAINEYGITNIVGETSGFWAVTEERGREILKPFKGKFKGIGVSGDSFHAEDIPGGGPNRNVSRTRRNLAAYLVAESFQDKDVGEFDPDANPLEDTDIQELYDRGHLKGITKTGNAAYAIAPFLPKTDIKEFEDGNCMGSPCKNRFDNLDNIHVDPYGNVFYGSGCVGIIMGTIGNEKDSLVDIVRKTQEPDGCKNNPVVKILVEKTVVGLLEFAEEKGFKRGEYHDSSHLCQLLRAFLVENGFFNGFIGPKEVYKPTTGEELGQVINVRK